MFTIHESLSCYTLLYMSAKITIFFSKKGTLGYEHVRKKNNFVLEYSRKWLKQHGGKLQRTAKCDTFMWKVLYE